MKNLITAGILLLSAALAQAADEYYVWVDENGVTNYAQEYPEGRDAIHVTTSHRFGQQIATETDDPGSQGSRPGVSQPVNTDADDAMAMADKQAASEREAILARIQETKRQNCEIGKKNLANLQVFSRIRVKGPDGEERVLTDAEKAKRTEEARQTIKENC